MKTALAQFVLSFILGAVPSLAVAEECTNMWDLSQVGTNPSQPKGLSGDANAAYPVFSFRGNPNIRYVIKGTYPRARFFSFETVRGQKDYSIDKIFDKDIIPDFGFMNPFLSGAERTGGPRTYTLHAVPEGSGHEARNQIKLPGNRLLHSFMMRIYAPDSGAAIDPRDIPRVFAFAAAGEHQVDCPRELYSDPYFHFPIILDRIYRKRPTFDFIETSIAWGPNSAIPSYLYAVNKVDKGAEVVVVRFKAPTFTDTRASTMPVGAQTRYWSICTQNAARNQTLACLPDHAAHPDANGIVTLVVGSGAAVRAAAAKAGHDFIEDGRGPRQSTMQFAYRNLLPAPAFQAAEMYKGAYLPRGTLYAASEYIRRSLTELE